MTELLYVPKRLYRDWVRRGWKIVNPEIGTREWAILMAPPDWTPPRRKPKDASEKGPVEEGN